MKVPETMNEANSATAIYFSQTHCVGIQKKHKQSSCRIVYDFFLSHTQQTSHEEKSSCIIYSVFIPNLRHYKTSFTCFFTRALSTVAKYRSGNLTFLARLGDRCENRWFRNVSQGSKRRPPSVLINTTANRSDTLLCKKILHGLWRH